MEIGQSQKAPPITSDSTEIGHLEPTYRNQAGRRPREDSRGGYAETAPGPAITERERTANSVC